MFSALALGGAVAPAQARTGDASVRIVDGRPVTTTQHPEVVAVGAEASFFCSGVVIAPRLVLTARHCLPATRVLFGITISQPKQIIAVERSDSAPDELDGALLTLAEDAPCAPARIALEAVPQPPRGLLHIVGFGTTELTGRRGFGQLRYADVPAAGWGCSAQRSRTLGCLPGIELVIFGFGNKDTCDGDSGGPVYAMDAQGQRLIAITSRPFRSIKERCGRGGLYLRIDALGDWLRQQLSGHRAQARTGDSR